MVGHMLAVVSSPVPVPGCAAIRALAALGDLGYWSVRDGDYELVPAADTYLRYLRYSRGRALGTTSYAGNLAVFFLTRCAGRQLGRTGGGAPHGRFRLGAAQPDRDSSWTRRRAAPRNGRINHILVSVREMYKSSLAHGLVGDEAIAALFVMGQLPDLGIGAALAALRPASPPCVARRGAGRCQPGDARGVQRPDGATHNWRDRLLLVLMRPACAAGRPFCCLRRTCISCATPGSSVAPGLARTCTCGARRPSRGSSAKSSRDRIVPVDAVTVFCADRWHYERELIPAADGSPTVLVNGCGENMGRPVRVDQVNSIVSDLCLRARLERKVTPHMLRHAWATGLAGVAELDVVKDLLGHRHLATTARYVHPEWKKMRDAIDAAYVDTLALDDAADADAR